MPEGKRVFFGCVPLDLRLGVPGRSLRPMLARISSKLPEFAAILGSVDQNRRNPIQLQALTSFSRRSSGTHPKIMSSFICFVIFIEISLLNKLPLRVWWGWVFQDCASTLGMCWWRFIYGLTPQLFLSFTNFFLNRCARLTVIFSCLRLNLGYSLCQLLTSKTRWRLFGPYNMFAGEQFNFGLKIWLIREVSGNLVFHICKGAVLILWLVLAGINQNRIFRENVHCVSQLSYHVYQGLGSLPFLLAARVDKIGD